LIELVRPSFSVYVKPALSFTNYIRRMPAKDQNDPFFRKIYFLQALSNARYAELVSLVEIQDMHLNRCQRYNHIDRHIFVFYFSIATLAIIIYSSAHTAGT